MKQKALVICPGRGTYNKDELGYLQRHHPKPGVFIQGLDEYRRQEGQLSISELDAAEKYSIGIHGRGDHASPLIYACAYSDFLAIDRNRFDIVAVTGNSMGWYIALACAGALTPADGMRVVNTMGRLMNESLIGGQLVYPLLDDDWQPIANRREYLAQLIHEINTRDDAQLFVSIALGGLLVFGGNEVALKLLEEQLTPQQRFPMRLHNHAAFHTPLQQPVAQMARNQLTGKMLRAPDIPLIDGQGQVWMPWSSDPMALWDYTFDTQICQTYDFTKAVQIAVKTFAPDCLIVTGPGNTLGGATAQSLVEISWQDLSSKLAFSARQKASPYLLSMGLEEQRSLVT